MDKRQEARQNNAHTDPFNTHFIFAAFKTGRFYVMMGYVPPKGLKKNSSILKNTPFHDLAHAK
jgi:hypothetical protein